ncbi:MAG: hypothetical protein GX754_00830 [Clostridiaceae bacterium]|nr:hypothetical protein [Clostridiaceae bacterium]
MAYVGRLYFRKDTGHLLYWYEYETIGNTPIPTIEQDIASIKPLKDFILENIHVVEIDQEDLLTREKVRRAKEILYDPQTEQQIFDIDSGVLAEIERRALLENRISQIETSIGNIQTSLYQKASLDEVTQIEQEKADIEQAIAELSILIAGGGA